MLPKYTDHLREFRQKMQNLQNAGVNEQEKPETQQLTPASRERAARQSAGACLSCGGMYCPGARKQKCRAKREVIDMPATWV